MLTISQLVTASIPQWTIRAALLASMDGRTIIEMPGLDKRPKTRRPRFDPQWRARGRRTSGEVGKVGRYHRIKRRRQRARRPEWNVIPLTAQDITNALKELMTPPDTELVIPWQSIPESMYPILARYGYKVPEVQPSLLILKESGVIDVEYRRIE